MTETPGQLPEIVKTKECIHLFHYECVLQWLDACIQKLRKPDCPLCRSNFIPDVPSEEEKEPVIIQTSHRVLIHPSQTELTLQIRIPQTT